MNRPQMVLIGIAVLLLAGAVGFLGYTAGRGSDTTQTPKPITTNETAPSDLDKLIWSFEELKPENEADAPRTAVMLLEGEADRKHNVGTYDGSCSVIEASAWTLLENEKTGVICWWAGGGKEIGVFEEDGKLVVKVGELEEGNEEVDGFRGNFELLFPLD